MLDFAVGGIQNVGQPFVGEGFYFVEHEIGLLLEGWGVGEHLQTLIVYDCAREILIFVDEGVDGHLLLLLGVFVVLEALRHSVDVQLL